MVEHAFGINFDPNPDTTMKTTHRRHFLRQAALATGAALGYQHPWLHAAESKPHPICAFVKFLQDLSFEDLAATIKRLGFDGIEGTIRPGGQIPPNRVEEDLPNLMAALKKEGLEMTIMASGINRADDPVSVKTLQTASKLGIKRYRMNYYRYDLSKPVSRQLADFRSMARDLADLNKELGIQALYQNHAGSRYLGSTLWDLSYLMRGIPVEHMAVGFDIRHAKVEGGMSWPVYWNMIQPHLGAVYVKDFLWKDNKVENVPLGKGWVDKAFFTQERLQAFDGPISLHVEYLQNAGLKPNTEALETDLATLREWL